MNWIEVFCSQSLAWERTHGKNGIIPILNRFSSFPRRRESRQPLNNGIPAFAGMTNGVAFDLKKTKSIGKRYYNLTAQLLVADQSPEFAATLRRLADNPNPPPTAKLGRPV